LIFPANFEEKTGFSLIRRMLAEFCLSDSGRRIADEMSFSEDHSVVIRETGLTEEFRQILLFDNRFPEQDYYDLIPEFKRIRLTGTFIEQSLLQDLKKSLSTILEILVFFRKKEEGVYPLLQELIKDVVVNKSILKAIEKIIDDRGNIRDEASEELSVIRKRLRLLNRNVERQIRQYLATAKKEGWADEGVEPTIRDGRSVLPILANHKRKIKGFIHDESSTGQTVYIEPAEVLETNNEIRELELAEKREIIRILTKFTDELRPSLPELTHAYHVLGNIDFIRAKTLFAIRTDSHLPVIRNETMLDWKNAWHPLLYLSHKAQHKEIIAQDITLDNGKRILVISGPNAGGKSVCLKMTGLLQYMLQCGMLIPVKETSEAGIFRNIFIEIGDEQSLENDLSTYSSHLLNMKYFVENADQETLFLIDEFGAGTEPQSGGAIAEAVLENLNDKSAFGIITTHYSNLKVMPSIHDGMVSGAMLFDVKQMKPLFKLKMGKPGSSFAFEIAGIIGLPGQIIEKASSKLDSSRLEYEKQLQQLETDKEEISAKEKAMKVADDLLAEVIDKYTKLYEETVSQRDHIINEARSEAKLLLENTNKTIERTIHEIRNSQADKEKTKEARKELEVFAEKIPEPVPVKTIPKSKPPRNKTVIPGMLIDNSPINTGDTVRMKDTGTLGEVLKIAGDKVTLTFGSMQVITGMDKIEKISGKGKNLFPEKRNPTHSRIIDELNQKKINFKPNIDFRGKRAEEVLNELQAYIDEAVLIGARDLSILHGKGFGILRKVIREYLHSREDVESFQDEHIERGGSGITIVKLR